MHGRNTKFVAEILAFGVNQKMAHLQIVVSSSASIALYFLYDSTQIMSEIGV